MHREHSCDGQEESIRIVGVMESSNGMEKGGRKEEDGQHQTPKGKKNDRKKGG